MPLTDRDVALRNSAIIADRVRGADLARLFTLPPEQAIAWFESLGIRVTWNWLDDWAQIQEQVFTLARVTDEHVLRDVKAEIARALEQGVSQRDFRRHLAERLEALGWNRSRVVTGPDGQLGKVDLSAPWRMDTIFRTNGQAALNAGRELTQLALSQEAPYWMYVAVMDERTRPGHALLNGLVFRHDDPIWKRIYPPCGFNCRCRVRALTQAMVDRRKLVVRSSSSFPLPEGAGPDIGFDRNPLTPGAIEEAAMRGLRARGPAMA